ncbi:MAG TPA: carbamoyltransferase C-terminal domain-containing protein [Solirubrobacteraceae bacterium]|jgi:carbamoyltransferase|nr:carbamoyltransferase C-terminal domain-containing protein [Solirubrobacteraceae bacterium]
MVERDGSAIFGRSGPRRPRLAAWGSRAFLPAVGWVLARRGLHRAEGAVARAHLAALERAIRAGREAYVLGFNTTSHNSGAALVRIDEHGRVELVCNEEEERYTGEKHCNQYPRHSVQAAVDQLRALGRGPGDLAACVSSWDFAGFLDVTFWRPMLEEAPASLNVLFQERAAVLKTRERPSTNGAGEPPREGVPALLDAPAKLGTQLGRERPVPIIGVRHHDAHAHFSYSVSPFAASAEPTITLVIDGNGDDATCSLYSCSGGRLTLLNKLGTSRLDSLGTMYAFISSTQGGWPPLSSEGRYMGATAWGDGNRLTNPYYRRLKHLFHFGAGGEVQLNRLLANWTRASLAAPYGAELIEILGEPIPPELIWNPDAVLDVEDVRHPELTRERVDKAAAVQLVFEDALVHMVEHAIRLTGSHRLVLTGGTALNCVANMRLLECFDERWFARNLDRPGTRLHLWVPSIPGDAGTPIGAAYAFALRAGARPGGPLRHAFLCGRAPSGAAIGAALAAEPAAASMALGDCADPETRARVADLLAYAVAGDRIVGIYQGSSETGPRALGHRSILANPCNPDTRRLLNERVKFRELVRPLAPMLTRAAAARFFELQEGAAEDDYNAYNYMVLTARARPQAYAAIPAVIHHDGTGRLQIVRPETDPFCHEFLLAMGRRAGVEASVNTSLNVGSPIVHTPAQALTALDRARGMDGLLMIAADGQATLVWRNDRAEARERLLEAVGAWAQETGFLLPELLSASR